MAGSGWRQWTRERLALDLLQGFLQDQVVQVHESTSARDAALTVPADGMVTFIKDIGRALVRRAGAWGDLGAQPRAQMHALTAQSGLANGWATITLDGETVDTHNGHAAAGPGFIVPAGQGGQWRVSGAVAVAAIASSGITVGVRVVVNGNPLVGSPPTLGPFSTPNGCIIPFPEHELTLAAGDAVTLQGFVGTGGWGTIAGGAAGASTSKLRVERIPS